MTDQTDRRALLVLAREAIVRHVTGRSSSTPAVGLREIFSKASGVFVSIHKKGDLRGCIGHLEADQPLGVAVSRCAAAACSSDPRFAAVQAGELPDLEIELSLLGPAEPIAGPGDVEVGRHGLIVEMGACRGVLLPQVAIEWDWGAETFLAQTCHKAGLTLDAWKRGARLWRFEAEVFSEAELDDR
jgi:AmmeMemoRadiSam system protein A